MEEKLSTIYLRDGRNALQYVMSHIQEIKKVLTMISNEQVDLFDVIINLWCLR